MKQPKSKRSSRASRTRNPYATLQTEDFAWLGEIHKVLSPYWSARSGYQGAWQINSGQENVSLKSAIR